MASVLRFVKIDAEGDGQATDVIEIERPGDLGFGCGQRFRPTNDPCPPTAIAACPQNFRRSHLDTTRQPDLLRWDVIATFALALKGTAVIKGQNRCAHSTLAYPAPNIRPVHNVSNVANSSTTTSSASILLKVIIITKVTSKNCNKLI